MRRILFYVTLLVLSAGMAYGFRLPKPPIFSYPMDKHQVIQLNDVLEKQWNLQLGEFNFDIETTEKTNSGNGDMWFVKTGGVVRIQYKGEGHIFTITPDGF